MADKVPAADPRDAVFDTSGLEKGMGRRVGKASLGVLAISILKMAIMFGGIAIIARLIPPSEFGIFALAMPAMGIAIALSNLGLPQAIVQRKTITHAEVTSLFWVNLGIGLCAALTIFALSWPAARLFDIPEVRGVYQGISISIALAAIVGQYGAVMRRSLRSARFELLVLTGEVCGLCVAIIAALAGASYWALVFQQITAQLVTAIAAILVTRWLPSSPLTTAIGPVRSALRFGGYLAAASITNRLMRYSGTLIAGAQLNATAAGLFTRALGLSDLPARRIMNPLSGTFVPALSILQDNHDEMARVFERMISRANLVLMPIGVLIATGAGPLVQVLLGPTWLAVTPILAWMSLRTLIAGANIGSRFALIASGHSRVFFLTSVVRITVTSSAIYLASGHGLLAMTITYMVVDVIFSLPVMTAVVLHNTALRRDTMLRACYGGLPLAGALIAVLMLVINPLIAPLPALIELGVIGLVIGLAYGIRIWRDPGMRRDVEGIVQKLLSKLPGPRRPA